MSEVLDSNDTQFRAYIVNGANWKKRIEINPNDFLNKEDLIMEVFTRGVESFFQGEIEVTGDGEVSIGFILFTYDEQDEGNEDKYMFVSSPIILANAGQYVAAKKVQDVLKKEHKPKRKPPENPSNN